MALAYLGVSVIWILLSDAVVAAAAADDPERYRLLQTFKGIGFIAVTAGCIYLAVTLAHARQRRLQEEKRLVEEMLIAAQRLEALGTLAGTLAHDFNNVLMVIRGIAEVAKLENYNADKMPAHIAEIDGATTQAGGIVRQLMLFSRNVPVTFTREDLGAIARDSRTLLQQAMGRQVELRLVIGGPLPPVRVVRTQVETALLNLAINARDAMAGTAVRRVVVEIAARKLDNYRSPFRRERASGEFVVVSVADSGCGIPREHFGRIFSPFFTTKPEGQGSGLGLPSILRVMQNHGGWVEVSSDVGQGARFCLFFPVAGA